MHVPEFDTDDADESGFKQLSVEEAQALRRRHPPLSLWRVVVWQAAVGLLVSLVTWGVTQNLMAGVSAAYGAMAVVLPAALLARGLSRQREGANAGSTLTGFFVWEMIKIALTVAMLIAAPRLILDLNWLALLAGFVVTMKVYWVAMWSRPARQDSINKN